MIVVKEKIIRKMDVIGRRDTTEIEIEIEIEIIVDTNQIDGYNDVNI